VSDTQFQFEFYAEIPDPEDRLRAEAYDRLLALTEGHTDIVGASVTLEELTAETTPHRYEAQVIVYIRPDNLAAVEKDERAELALKGALSAVERQVREFRNKLREQWKHP
jgi:ribosome-associated translation inhibitor RaiA